MVRQCASMETIPAISDYHFDSLYRPSLRKRSSSYHYLADGRASKVVDLTYPDQAAFPSPLQDQDLTPSVRASKARDTFPFPAHPAETLQTRGVSRDSPDPSHHAKRRCISHGNTYLTPPSSPDRFIHSRPSGDSHVTSYKISKSPEQLSITERLLRHNSATPDPFSPRSPQQIEDDATSFRDRVARTNHSTRYGANGNILGLRSASVDLQPRRVSNGAVWNVGGTAAAGAPVTGVPNGRGGLLGSGTNAPMFTSRFFEEETADQSIERFEGRVAAALDIDQISRTLHVSPSPDRRPQSSSSNSNNKSKESSPTVWRDGGWTNDGNALGKWSRTTRPSERYLQLALLLIQVDSRAQSAEVGAQGGTFDSFQMSPLLDLTYRV